MLKCTLQGAPEPEVLEFVRGSCDALREAAYFGSVEVFSALLEALRPLSLEDTLSFKGERECALVVFGGASSGQLKVEGCAVEVVGQLQLQLKV